MSAHGAHTLPNVYSWSMHTSKLLLMEHPHYKTCTHGASTLQNFYSWSMHTTKLLIMEHAHYKTSTHRARTLQNFYSWRTLTTKLLLMEPAHYKTSTHGARTLQNFYSWSTHTSKCLPTSKKWPTYITHANPVHLLKPLLTAVKNKKTFCGQIFCRGPSNTVQYLTYIVSKAIQISAIYHENVILHELFRVVSRFPRYISCYIAESRLPLGQCSTKPVQYTQYVYLMYIVGHR